MLWPITHETWQQLRVLVRAKGEPVSGKDIRLKPSRTTKSGEFLDALVEKGLLTRGQKRTAVTPDERRRPVQFRTLYTLTEKGKYAAEYGEYERDGTGPAAQS